MINRSTIITGLDIGSSKISVVMAGLDSSGVFSVIAHATVPSRGVTKGVVDGLDEAIDSVSKTLGKLRAKTTKRIDNVYVNISSQAVKGQTSKGMIPISLRGREVTKGDMTRCVNVASIINLPLDKEIIHKVVNSFSIDDQPFIRNPEGLSASRLTCEAYVVTAGINQIQNIYKCVDSSGYDVKEVVFTGIADAASILDEEDKTKNVMLLNMGDSLIEISFFLKGILNDLDVIPMGAKDIKGGFKDSSEFNEIIARINLKMQDFSKRNGGGIDYVMLTGGLAFTDGVIESLEEKLACPVKMGVSKDVRGEISNVDSMRLVTAIGLAKYGYEKIVTKKKYEGSLFKRTSAKVVDVLNNYF